MMWSDPLFWVMLVYQAFVQVYFLMRFYTGSLHNRKLLLVLWVLIALVLGPIDQMIPASASIWRNLLNLVVMSIAGFFLDRWQSPGHLFKGVALWWIALPLAEMICLMTTLLIYGEIPDFQHVYEYQFYNPAMFAFQIYCGTIVWVLYVGELHLFSARREDDSLNLVYGVLIMTAGLMAFMTTTFWSFQFEYAGFSYHWMPAALILLLNGVLAGYLFFRIRKRTIVHAGRLVQKEYTAELERLLAGNEKETRLRRLRHDLINFLDDASSLPHEKMPLD